MKNNSVIIKTLILVITVITLETKCSSTLLDTTTLTKTSGPIALKSESKSTGPFYY